MKKADVYLWPIHYVVIKTVRSAYADNARQLWIPQEHGLFYFPLRRHFLGVGPLQLK